MARRAQGEGSIYPIRDKAGKIVRYGASITIGYQDGKRIRKKVEARTRKEVAEKLATLRQAHAHGVDLTARPQTIRVYFAHWLDTTFAEQAKPKSIVTYSSIMRHQIFPLLGDVLIGKLTPKLIREWLAALRQQGLADSTIALAYTVGRQAMQQAVIDSLVDQNPFAKVRAPRVAPREAAVITTEQARAFLEAAHGERLEVALRLMLALGLRRGEVCGLRLEDLDLETGRLSVKGTLQYIAGVGMVWGTPKSESGRRSFKLPAALLAALTWHLQQLARERALMGTYWQESPYLFVASTTGGPIDSHRVYTAFKRVARRAGLAAHLHPHTLRHACASFLHAEGLSTKTISVMLGHANTTITNNVYVHLFQEDIDDAAGRVEDRLGTAHDDDDQRRFGS